MTAPFIGEIKMVGFNFAPRGYATRTDWQLGEPIGTARVWISDRIDWLVERHFGHAGEIVPAA